MTAQPLAAIVRGEHIDNRTAGGRTYARVRGLLQYITYGHYEDYLGEAPRPRGTWLDQAGREHEHEAVRTWAREKVQRFHYDHAYQLLLSARDGDLSASEFNQALQRGSGISEALEWRFMVHDDTDRRHAHAVLFSREKLPSVRYKIWQQTMQAELGRLQDERQSSLTQQTEMKSELAAPADHKPEQARQEGWTHDFW